MKVARWQVRAALLLLLLSAGLYGLQILLGQSPDAVLTGFLGNIAFLPVYVLFVAIMLQEWLNWRERLNVMNKLNMVIGAFFTEMGTQLIRLITAFDSSTDSLRPLVLVNGTWTDQQFRGASDKLRSLPFGIASQAGDLEELREFMVSERGFLLRLLENPNLLEHESFTELLWAVSHLAEELAVRSDLVHLPAPDLKHISVDMTRAYGLVLSAWIEYMRHLKARYPYLFSLAVRTNPFDPNARPELPV